MCRLVLVPSACNAVFAHTAACLPATGSSSSASLSLCSEILKSDDVSLSYRLSCPEPLSSSAPRGQGDAAAPRDQDGAGELSGSVVGVAEPPTSEVTALPLSLSK